MRKSITAPCYLVCSVKYHCSVNARVIPHWLFSCGSVPAAKAVSCRNCANTSLHSSSITKSLNHWNDWISWFFLVNFHGFVLFLNGLGRTKSDAKLIRTTPVETRHWPLRKKLHACPVPFRAVPEQFQSSFRSIGFSSWRVQSSSTPIGFSNLLAKVAEPRKWVRNNNFTKHLF